jgi:hypothetical protein
MILAVHGVHRQDFALSPSPSRQPDFSPFDGETTKSEGTSIHVQFLVRTQTRRSKDTHRNIIRRLSPESNPIEIADLPEERTSWWD